METCPHANLSYVGDQKTDIGMNVYYKCDSCGCLVVVTPTDSYAIKGQS